MFSVHPSVVSHRSLSHIAANKLNEHNEPVMNDTNQIGIIIGFSRSTVSALIDWQLMICSPQQRRRLNDLNLPNDLQQTGLVQYRYFRGVAKLAKIRKKCRLS